MMNVIKAHQLMKDVNGYDYNLIVELQNAKVLNYEVFNDLHKAMDCLTASNHDISKAVIISYRGDYGYSFSLFFHSYEELVDLFIRIKKLKALL